LEEFEELVNQVGCGEFYWKSEACLDQNNRDLRKCQQELKEFAICFNQNKGKLPSQQPQAHK
jgi:hypothetical protein